MWTLAWPAVALNSLAVINNLLDTGFVGRLEPAAITAQGASLAVIFLLFQIAFALGTAATALVSRAFGAEEHIEVRMATRQCLSLSVWIGVGLMAVCALLGLVVPYALIPASNHEAGVIRVRGKQAGAVASHLGGYRRPARSASTA